MKPVYLLGAVILLGLVQETAAEEPEIRIGLFTELTGTFAASAGRYCREGYETARRLYADRAGQYRLRFIYGDTQGDSKTALSEFVRLLDAERAHVLVSNRSQVGLALTPLAVQRKFPLVAVMGYSRLIEDNPYAFRFYSSAEHEAAALAEKMLELGYRSAALISLEDEWYQSFREHFRRSFFSGGGEICFDDSAAEGLVSFEPLVGRIRSCAPRAVVVNLGPTKSGLFVRQLRSLGVNARLFGNYYARAREVFAAAGSEALEGLITVEMDSDKPQLLRQVQQIFPDADVNPLTWGCFSGLAFVLHALEEAESAITTSQELYAALLKVSKVPLADGDLPLRGREAMFSFTFKQVHNGGVADLPSNVRSENVH